MIKILQVTLLLLIVISHNATFSQNICTDVSPDLTVSSSYSLDIDLNNDLTSDFRIVSGNVPISYLYVAANQIGTSNFILTNTNGEALALSLNTIIGSTSNIWQQMNSNDAPMLNPVPFGAPYGPWLNAIDKYLGLRLVVGSNTYYGWARFTMMTNSTNYVFKDYAYNSTPNQAILAGQGCAPVSSPSFYLDTLACSGYTTNVTANTGTLTASGYTWSSNPAGPLFSAGNASVTDVSFPSGGIYTLNLSITSSSTVSSITETIQVIASPSVVASISPSTFCYGVISMDMFTLTASGASTYTFLDISSPPFSSTVGIGTDYSDYFSSTTLYKVVATVNGCTSFDTISVLGIPPPDFSVTASPSSICAGSSATLVVSNPTLSYTWYENNSTTVSAIGSSIVVTPTVFPFSYFVYGTDGVCESFTGGAVQEKVINVGIHNSFKPICIGESVKLSVYGAASYTWFPAYALSTTSGATVIASPTITTNYTVTGTTGNCVSKLKVVQAVDPCVGLTEAQEKTIPIYLYPNPTKERLYINTFSELTKKIEIYNLDGRMVLKEEIISDNNGDGYVDVNFLAAGVYVVKVISSDNVERLLKMIKE